MNVLSGVFCWSLASIMETVFTQSCKMSLPIECEWLNIFFSGCFWELHLSLLPKSLGSPTTTGMGNSLKRRAKDITGRKYVRKSSSENTEPAISTEVHHSPGPTPRSSECQVASPDHVMFKRKLPLSIFGYTNRIQIACLISSCYGQILDPPGSFE